LYFEDSLDVKMSASSILLTSANILNGVSTSREKVLSASIGVVSMIEADVLKTQLSPK
jgi:hypothetical protein